jgi:hypothetical protein
VCFLGFLVDAMAEHGWSEWAIGLNEASAWMAFHWIEIMGLMNAGSSLVDTNLVDVGEWEAWVIGE